MLATPIAPNTGARKASGDAAVVPSKSTGTDAVAKTVK